MQKEIHPKYHDGVTVTCSCGNTFKVGSTKENIKIEICSACHPFYVGGEKIVDTAGRVERFKARAAKQGTAAKNPAKKAKPAKSAAPLKG
jgi:large subunit ribosomal protein L31